MHVLIVKTSSMGDVLHTLPALTDAMNALPDIRFDWVVEEGFSQIPSWHPAVDKVISVDGLNLFSGSMSSSAASIFVKLKKGGERGAVNNINDIATNATDSAVQTARAGDELAQLAARLTTLLAQFRI